MLTAGVDLAAESARTAMAIVKWSSTGAVVTELGLGVDDKSIVDTMADVEKLGIDCPFGWPDDFVQFLNAHHRGNAPVPANESPAGWRRRLAYRETDRFVRDRTGLNPLSVASDRIALTAMRAAGLLSRMAADGQPVDRLGAGRVVEVYPAASLKRWNLQHRGYKRRENQPNLQKLVSSLQEMAPWLDLGSYESRCCESDDAFDAVIAALASRAAAVGRTDPPHAHQQERARTEGWIALPNCELNELVQTN